LSDAIVVFTIEGGSPTNVAHATRAADAMHIFEDAPILYLGKVTIDDVTNVSHVPAA
jgi:hypothetical protein